MDSFILDIAKTLNIPDFLFRVIPNFYEHFSNWYFSNYHHWEYIPDDLVTQESSDDSDNESEISWYISSINKENKDDHNTDDLFEDSDNISDTGSDYSLYWYNSD